MAPGPIVRIPLVSLEDRSEDFLAGMQKHGYVVLTDTGDGEAKYGE